MSIVLAFDLSTTAAGVCANGETSTIKPGGSLPVLARAQLIAHQAERIASRLEPELIVVEAYATRFVHVAYSMGLVHGLTLDAVEGHAELPVLLPDPKRLKKFATGNANADKWAMFNKASDEGWVRPEGADDNQSDAWWLWVLGKAWLNQWVVPETAYRIEILTKIREDLRPS